MSGVPSIAAPAASSLIGGPSASGVLVSPSGPPKRLKNDKSSKKNNVRPAAIQQARTGYTRLISVSEFRQNFLELERQLDKDLPAADAAIDTSIEDVKVETPFQAIERAITMELARQGSSPEDEKKLAGSGDSIMDQYGMLTLPVAIPELKALQDPLIPLKKKRRKQIGKLVRKELNCMTEKTLQTEIEDRTKSGHVVPLRDREVILKVAVYHPHLYNKSQEFLVLGSQTLTALRDRIICHSDEELDGAQSPSAFFFIENKFYNDTRDRRAIKYSDPIINWVKSEDRYTHPGLSHFEARTMQDVTFNDLSIRLGSHYLYQHQGECKHVIMFTDLRMAHNLDVQNAIAYPIKVFQSKTRRKKCRVCDLFAAKMVTYSDRLAHENPFFWCEQCYKLYHYNAQGVILYSDFQVYPYTGHE